MLMRINKHEDYTQGILFVENKFVCYTLEHPMHATSEKAIPNFAFPAHKFSFFRFYNEGSDWRMNNFFGDQPTRLVFNPDNMGDYNIACGMTLTPFGGISQCDVAQGRLTVIGKNTWKLHTKCIDVEGTPFEWMSPYFKKMWRECV